MARFSYERLSAADNAFLLWETPEIHMHVSGTAIFAAAPLRTRAGGIDIERLRGAIGSVLHRIPRYRQKLAWIPGFRHAVWVDDEHFSLGYHIRHTSLPRPGSDAQLKRLAARVMAQPLDRERPLWELWFVEGLEGDRFAVINKTHHCMIDGISGMDLTAELFSPERQRVLPPGPTFIPRRPPTARELFRDECRRVLSTPARVSRLLRSRGSTRGELMERLRALRALGGLLGTDDTPLNGRVGPHRSFDWLETSLADAKAVKNALSCTVNDVVLAIATGAFRDYLLRRQVRPEGLQFQIQAPVSTRAAGETGPGNRVSTWTVPLPVGEPDPRAQLDAIYEHTQHLKETRQALGIDTITAIAEWTTSSLLSLGARAAHGTTNSLITNVPGPQFPLYLLGAEQLALYPQPPLLPNVGLAIGVVSYNGRLCWGLNADYELVPDLPVFADLLRASFRRLARVAGVEPGASARPARARPPRRRAAHAAATP